MKLSPVFSQYVAEFVGTFFLVFFGCGAIILSELEPSSMPVFIIPLIFGGTVSIMIYALGHISGAHFNPAVTLAFTVVKKFPLKKVVGYLTAQFLGALLASWFHSLIWGKVHSFGATQLHTSLGVGIGLEIILSLVLMLVIISVATDARAKGELAGIAIGSAVALCAFVGGSLTGASMNPARSLAPAIFQGNFEFIWVYLLFPVIGTILGAVLYQSIKCDGPEDHSHGCC